MSMQPIMVIAMLIFAASAIGQSSDSVDPSRVTRAMSQKGQHDMGPHMKLTALRESTAADQKRAGEIIAQAKQAIKKYHRPEAAEAGGFQLFMPKVKKQRQYHYTNYRNAMEAAFRFDAARPTSLLYEDDSRGQKKLIGVMYTAPARFSEEELHERIPLSVAQWHLHVNLCAPPKDQRQEMFRPNARFGLSGSIATKAECEAAGGAFRPRVFGWMVHMYPWEKTSDAIWSVARQGANPMMREGTHKH